MSNKNAYLLGFLIICGLLLTSLYLQFFQGIEPCPLCSLQRITFAIIGLFLLVGVFTHRKPITSFLINGLISLFSIAGMVLAGRQIWLQRFPSTDGSECGVSLQYMMQVLPWHQVAQKIFQGTAECTQRGWEFMTLNMAEWAIIWFVLFFLLSIYLFKRR